MEIIKLILVFLAVVVVMAFKKPLYLAMFAGILTSILAFGLDLGGSFNAMLSGVLSKDMLNLVLSFYIITFLQRMMEKRDQLILAEEALERLFNSRRINAMLAPFVIGILPSPGAVVIAAPIVDKAGGSYLTKEEKTFVTSYFRHISESFMPTYGTILLALSLSKVDMTQFVIAMVPLVFLLFFLGYIFYVRKIPRSEAPVEKANKKEEVKILITSLWPIGLTIFIILFFKIEVFYAGLIVVILSYFINKFKPDEIRPIFRSALELRVFLNTGVIMMFKGIINYTGVVERLPLYFSGLGLDPRIIFAMIFLFGSIVAGAQGMIAIALPLAFASIGDGGVSLLVLLMSMSYIAMQISPTHICLGIITEYNKTSFIDLVKNTMPIFIIFIILSSLYSYLLYLIT